MSLPRSRAHVLLILVVLGACAALAAALAGRADANGTTSTLYFSKGARLGTVLGTTPATGLNPNVQSTETYSEYAWSDGTVTYWSGPDGIWTSSTGTNRDNFRAVVTRAATGFRAVEAFVVVGNYVYFTRWGGANGGVTSIARARVDGTDQEVNLNFITGGFQWARGLAAQDGLLYIADESGGKIWRAPLSGGAATELVSSAGNSPTTVAVDGRFVYWTPRFRNTIARARIDGSNPQLDFIPLATAAAQPWGVDVDGTHVYWTMYAAGGIGRANIDGTNVNEAWVPTASLGFGVTSLNVLPGPARLAPIPAPVSTGAPTVSGTPSVGNQLTATAGTWASTPLEIAYQWQVSSDGSTDWANATGTGNATSQYTVAAADTGKYLRVRVRASDGGASTTVDSAATAPVPIPAPTNTARPVVTGTAAIGSQLFGTLGSWSASPTAVSYQWQGSEDGTTGWADLVTPSGGSLFTPTLAEAGMYLRLRVSITAGGDWATAFSLATARIPVPPPVNVTPPSASGSVAVGARLTANPGTWTPAPREYAYQWEASPDGLSGWAPAPGIGAGTATYGVEASDLGRYLRVRVRATTVDGASTSEASAAIGPVAEAPPSAAAGAAGGGGASSAAATCAAVTGRPVGVTINDDAEATNRRAVTIGISAPSCDSTVTVSNNGSFRDARTFPVAAEIPWTLVASRSERLPKTVYVRFGTSTQTFTDDIILDQTPPVLRRAIVSPLRGSARLRVVVRERGSGLAQVQASRRRGAAAATPLRLRGTAVRVRSVRDVRWARVSDRAGNWSRWVRVTRR